MHRVELPDLHIIPGLVPRLIATLGKVNHVTPAVAVTFALAVILPFAVAAIFVTV